MKSYRSGQVGVLGGWLADLRHAARACARRPGFTAATVVTLALGIGGSTAVFSVVYGVLLKPLPFDEPGRLVSVRHQAPALGVVNHGPGTYFTYLESQRSFEGIGAWEGGEANITGAGDPEQVEVLSVSSATLPLLRVQPVLGRPFTAEDDTPGSPPRAMLTHGFWQRRYGGAQTVIGQTLEIDGAPAEIVGVLPPSFRLLNRDPAVVLPMRLDPAEATAVEFDFGALARLKPGVTVDEANADLARMIRLLPEGYGAFELRPYVRPLADEVIGDVGRLLWILQAAVAVVLLIACGNVANLFLIRAEGRQQELALRAALGAGRGRIARVLLSESLLLALGGGVLGLVFARAALGLLRRLAPAQLPRADEIGIDLTVLLFTLAVSVLSGLLFGAFAVWKYGKPNIDAIKEGGRSGSDSPGRHRTRNALVVSQVALALMMMIASGLMVRTFLALNDVRPGFVDPENVQTFRLTAPDGILADQQALARTHQAIAERIAQVPGVTSVGISSSITMDGEDNTNPVYVEGVPVAEGALPPLRRYKSFAPGYFETMGIPVVEGRSLTWAEIYQGTPVLVVSAALAREYWADPAEAIGKRIRATPESPWREIVGVVGDERDDGLDRPATPIVYWPLLNETYQQTTFAYAVRSDRVGAPGFLRELEEAAWSVNPNLPFAAVQTLEEVQARSMAETSFAMTMLVIAAAVSLLLGIVGIYGVIAFVVAQRTREIGIRMALGAEVGDVQMMFLRHGLWLTGVGIALGIGAALVLTRVMSALLFGVGRLDVVTYAAVSAGLAAVALLATYLPARRVSRIEPSMALRGGA